MLVQDFLEQSAAHQPDKVALVGTGQRFTYAEVESRANRLARALNQCGVARGDRVVLHLPNCVEAVVAVFAVLKAGAVFVTVNRTTKAERLIRILNDCQATALVTDARALAGDMPDRLQTEVESLLSLVVHGGTSRELTARNPHFLDFTAIQHAFQDTRPQCRSIDLDLACLIYTSGTTGEAKVVMCDHSSASLSHKPSSSI